MSFPSIYLQSTTDDLVSRINKIENNKAPLWGKMNASQMMAHCCVPYELLLDERKFQAPWVIKFLGKYLFKGIMTSEKIYPKNSPTGKDFIINDKRDFMHEKNKLLGYVTKCHALGENYFEGKKHSFIGDLRAREWSILLYKHLDHHLRQFGV